MTGIVSSFIFCSLYMQCDNTNNVERPFVVVICSYNASSWVEKNLRSVAQQKYTNYRIMYVDDGSLDSTVDCVNYYAGELGIQEKLTLISHKKRRRKLANMYDAIHLCSDEEIVILLDGDDWLEDDSTIFQNINDAYQKHDCWFTYSQYRNEPKSEAQAWGFRETGYSAPVPSHIQKRMAYRNYPFVFMHLRTFYAWLFKQVKLEDLLTHTIKQYKGQFFPASNDLAIVFPMVEMAHTHVHFMKETLCVRNVYSNIVGFKVDNSLQVAASSEIRRQTPYSPLIKRPAYTKQKTRVEAFLFYDNNLDEIKEAIKTIKLSMRGASRIVVFYEKNKKTISDIRELQKIVSCDVHGYDTTSFCITLKKYITNNKITHTIICFEPLYCKRPCFVRECASQMHKTGAYAYHFIKEVPSHGVQIGKTCAWNYNTASGIYKKPHYCGAVLYRAETILGFFENSIVTKSSDIKKIIRASHVDSRAIGLASL